MEKIFKNELSTLKYTLNNMGIYVSNNLNVKIAEIIYTVMPGDTLSEIAEMHIEGSNPMKILMEYNKITDPSKIFIGQKIKIPQKQKYKCSIPYEKRTDKVELMKLADCISAEVGVGKELFKALITVESNWNPDVKSSANAYGLGQITQVVINEYGVSDPFDPVENLYASAKYLKKMLMRFQGYRNLRELGLMAYHAGVTNVLKWVDAGSPKEGYAGVGKYTLEYPKKIESQIANFLE